MSPPGRVALGTVPRPRKSLVMAVASRVSRNGQIRSSRRKDTCSLSRRVGVSQCDNGHVPFSRTEECERLLWENIRSMKTDVLTAVNMCVIQWPQVYYSQCPATITTIHFQDFFHLPVPELCIPPKETTLPSSLLPAPRLPGGLSSRWFFIRPVPGASCEWDRAVSAFLHLGECPQGSCGL